MCYSKPEAGLLNILSIVMRCRSRDEEGVSNIVEIVSMMGRQGKYMYRLGGVS